MNGKIFMGAVITQSLKTFNLASYSFGSEWILKAL